MTTRQAGTSGSPLSRHMRFQTGRNDGKTSRVDTIFYRGVKFSATLIILSFFCVVFGSIYGDCYER